MTISSSLKKELNKNTDLIQNHLALIFEDQHISADEPESRLLKAMKYVTLCGGKRLRPFIVLQSANLFDVNPTQALQVAAAIELIHCYSITHDDLPAMDNCEIRRGQMSCHRKYDEATAVLVGDALQSLAFEVLSSDLTHSSHKIRCELIRGLAIASGLKGMAGGQMIDMRIDKVDFDLNLITRLQKLKTGALINYAGQAPAIMGYASIHEKQALLAYTQKLGLAYQMTDDILDHEGRVEVVGKDVRKDQIQKKATYITVMGIEQAKEQVNILRKQAFDYLEIFGNHTKLLRDLFDFIVERTS